MKRSVARKIDSLLSCIVVNGRAAVPTGERVLEAAVIIILSDIGKGRAIVQAETDRIAIDTRTYPDWADTKENLLKAVELVRKLERDQMWSKLSKR